MFRTVIAGCDGSERGRAAVAFASTVAQATSARLLLVAAYPQLPLPVPAGYRDQTEQAERALRAVRDELAPAALTMTVGALSPSHALRHVAEREHADLIVVGSRHRSRVGHIIDADHAMQVLHGAPAAVAVVPDEREAPSTLDAIAVAFDGSPESHGALAAAVDLARRTDARLWLQAVVPDSLPGWTTVLIAPPPGWSAGIEKRQNAAWELIKRTLAGLQGVQAEGGVAVGDPERELAALSASTDLLVIGSRRWGPLARLALGSTSDWVVRHAAGPVLVLPRGTSERGRQPDGPAARATAP